MRPDVARSDAITYEKQAELPKWNLRVEYINISRSFKLAEV